MMKLFFLEMMMLMLSACSAKAPEGSLVAHESAASLDKGEREEGAAAPNDEKAQDIDVGSETDSLKEAMDLNAEKAEAALEGDSLKEEAPTKPFSLDARVVRAKPGADGRPVYKSWSDEWSKIKVHDTIYVDAATSEKGRVWLLAFRYIDEDWRHYFVKELEAVADIEGFETELEGGQLYSGAFQVQDESEAFSDYYLLATKEDVAAFPMKEWISCYEKSEEPDTSRPIHICSLVKGIGSNSPGILRAYRRERRRGSAPSFFGLSTFSFQGQPDVPGIRKGFTQRPKPKSASRLEMAAFEFYFPTTEVTPQEMREMQEEFLKLSRERAKRGKRDPKSMFQQTVFPKFPEREKKE